MSALTASRTQQEQPASPPSAAADSHASPTSSASSTSSMSGAGSPAPVLTHPEAKVLGVDTRSPKGVQPAPAAPLSPGPASPTRRPLTYLESMLVLTQGATFIKYAGKSNALVGMFGGGAPVTRYVFYEKGEERGGLGAIWWCKEGRRSRDPERCIPLRSITGLFEQAETAAFSGKIGATLTPEARERCFSIVAKDRTLDLQAASVEQRAIWMHAIHTILVNAGFSAHEQDPAGNPAAPRPVAPSPTSDSLAAIDAARKLNALHVRQTSSSLSSYAGSNAGSPPPHGMQSPPSNAASPPVNTPLAAGSKFTPANSPSNDVIPPADAGVRSNPLPAVHEDPLAAAKLIESLSPSAAANLANDVSREIPATLRMPNGGEELPVSVSVLSPSEHPTQTPACSPVNA